MEHSRERQKIGREKLHRIIQTYKTVEERVLDPFLIDVDSDIKSVKEYFPEWTIAEDLTLDAETINHIASVIKLQGEWVKHRSTSLYTDPFLLEEKMRRLSKAEITESFAGSWHPIIELEQITISSMAEALGYWMDLLPLGERWKEAPPNEVAADSATREELIRERILRDRAFSVELEDFWHELKDYVKSEGDGSRIAYWDFIGADTYDKTVQRAFLASFLVTYGYATLVIYPLEEETFIQPHEKPVERISSKQLVSVPISVSFEGWKKWKRGEIA